MLTFVAVSMLIHAFTMVRVHQFFLIKAECPENDKIWMATLGLLSVMFVLIHTVVLILEPAIFTSGGLAGPLLVGLKLTNAVFYYCQARAHLEHRQDARAKAKGNG